MTEVLTRKQAAAFLQMSEDALAQHAHRGTGPRFSKISHRTVRYRRADLEAWLEDLARTSTRASTAS